MILLAVAYLAALAVSIFILVKALKESVRKDIEWWYVWAMRIVVLLYFSASVGIIVAMVKDLL